jgi:hypothetical protein
MTSMALPVSRREMPHLGVAALLVLALMSAALGLSNPEAITAEYQTTASVLVGP